MKTKLWITILLIMLTLTACGTESGQLEIHANGEDFVRQGFVSKDGWSISFDHVYMTLAEIRAYQEDTPFDASTGEMPAGSNVSYQETTTVDLAQGDENADPIVIATLDAPTGQYNAISWQIVNGEDSNTLQLVGTAEKDGTTLPFDIQINETYAYACGEYVGDSRNGFVDADSSGNIEMTFHFDHVFGDGDADADDPLNTGALGFDPLANLAENGAINQTQADLMANLSDADYAILLDTLATLGHVGEGHCYEATNGFTAKDEE